MLPSAMAWCSFTASYTLFELLPDLSTPAGQRAETIASGQDLVPA